MTKILSFKNSLLTVTLTLSATSLQAYAFDMNEINQSNYEKAFQILDVDNSASISKEEAKKSDYFSNKHFTLADANHDGNINQEEFTNYQSKMEKKNLKRVISDSTITSKIKSNLLKDEGLKSLRVSVETHQGVVILSGFVKTEGQKNQAEKIAEKTEGVTDVKNRLELKKED